VTEHAQALLGIVDTAHAALLGIGEAAKRLRAYHREDVFLAREVAIRRHRAAADLGRNRAHGHRGVAGRREQPRSGVADAVTEGLDLDGA